MVHPNPDFETRSEPNLDADASLRVLMIFDRPRPGSVELSCAFACHAKNADRNATLLHAVHDPAIPSEPWSFGNLWRRAAEADLVVVGSYGRTALLLPLLFWMARDRLELRLPRTRRTVREAAPGWRLGPRCRECPPGGDGLPLVSRDDRFSI
jgi:hypothetical protein